MKTNFTSRILSIVETFSSFFRNPRKQLLILALVCSELAFGQINSYVYYSFDNALPYTSHIPSGSELTSTCSSCTLSASTNTPIGTTDVIVDNYLEVLQTGEINCGGYSPLEPQGSFSIEFLAKLDPSTGSNSSIYFFKVGTVGGSNYSTYGRIVQYPEPMIEFSIKRWNITNVATEYKFDIPLNGIGRKSIGYYTDQKWHHYAFVYNNDLGSGDPGYSQMKVWIDGQCPNEFADNRVPYFNKADYNAGPFTSNIYLSFGTLNSSPQYLFHGGMDEIAIFNNTLPDEQIFENYNNAKNNSHYQGALSTSPMPIPDPVYPTVLDPLDFASGYDVSSFGDPKDSYHAAQVIDMPETQLSNFPLPRYKPGVFMYPNYNWMSSKYMAGELQPGTTFSNKEIRSGNIQLELASNWNYYFNLAENVASDRSGFSNPSTYSGTWVSIAKLHPNLKFAATLYRIQLNIESVLGPNPLYGQSSMLKFQNFTTPSIQSGFIKNYFKNASGYVPPTNKVWCPAADTVEYNWDAKAVVKILNDLDVATGNLPISILGENNEYSKFYTVSELNNDADAYSDRISKGLAETPYQSLRKQWIDQSYSKRIIDYRPNFNNISFLNYDVDGKDNDRWDYAYQRLTQKMVSNVSSPITENLPTPFFYPQTPENWRQEAGGGDIHGLNWIINSRNGEIALNDYDFAPFIGAGWSKNESYNIRPAQWLGLLKLNCGLGARFFNVGFFNDDPSYAINAPANPKGYIWQATTPSYALGVYSHVMEFFPSNSSVQLFEGNTALSPSTNIAPLGSLFTLGSPEKVAIVRKMTASENYLISSTLQQFSIGGNTIPDVAEANITLNSKTLKFNIRKQGSVYRYDNLGANPIFYQLDSWHENTHPEYWSKDFYFEAEVPDNTPSSISLSTLDKNDVPYLSTSSNFDFTKYTTFVTANAGTTLDYSFKPREDNKVYYIFIKARLNPSSLITATAEATLNIFSGIPSSGVNIASKNIKCVTDKNWQWYAIDNVSNTQIQFQTTSKGDYYLEIAPLNSNFQIDKILISENPNPIFEENNLSYIQNSCSPLLVPILTDVTNINCNGGGNTGAITILSPTGAGWTYSKDGVNFQSSPTFQNLSANTYPIKAQNSNGKYTIAKYTLIEEPKPLIVVLNNVNPKCSSSNDGRILASVTGGTSPYNYLWSNGSTNELITGLSNGTYTTTVTDKNGCTVISNPISINSPLPLSLSYAVTTTPACNATNGAILISASGGTPVYEISKDATNYSSFTGNTNTSINSLAQGSYDFYVRDYNNCISQLSNVTVGANIPSGISFINPLCSGSSNGSISYPSSFSSLTYRKLPQTNNISYTSGDASLSAGIYQLSFVENGCSYKYNVTLTDPAPITISSNITPTSCSLNNGAIKLNLAGGVGAYNILWNTGQSSNVITNLSSAVYTATITDGNACQLVRSYSVPQENLILNSSTKKISCYGEADGAISISVNSNAGTLSYNWSNGATTQNISGLIAGSYNVTVTSSLGCTGTFPISIDLLNPTNISLSSTITNINCLAPNSGKIALSVTGGTGGYSYLWINGSTSSTISNLTTGTYTVTVTDNNTCTSSASYTVNQAIAINLSSSITNVNCYGGTTGGIDLTVSGGTPAFTYSWNNGATSQDLSGLTAGNYTVTVTDNNSCTTSASYTVSQANAISLSTNITNVTCNGASTGVIDLTVSGGTPTYSYIWNNGATSQDLSGLTAGNYTVTVTDNNSCSSSANYTVSQASAISLSTNITNVNCYGASTGVIDLEVSGGTPTFTYSWNNGATSQDLSGLTAGNYTVTVTNSNFCTASASYTVSQPSAISIITSNVIDETCWGENNGSISLLVSGGTAPYSYLWSNSATSPSLNNIAHGNYTVIVTDNASCTRISHNINIGVSDCCKNGLDLSFTNTTGPLQLNSDFTINAGQSLSINSATLMCASNKKIIVKGGGILNISATTIQSCSNNMWGGIEAEPGSSVHINNNSLIRDAIIGLNATDNSSLNTDIIVGGGTTFDRNNISVSLTGGEFSYANFNGTYFKCTGVLKKSPYNTLSGNYTKIHIVAKNAGTINLGGINGNSFSTVFEDADICVYTEETNLNLDNCKFSLVNNNSQSNKSAVMCNSYDPNQAQPNNNFYNILVGNNSGQSGSLIRNEFNNYKIGVSVYRNCNVGIVENNFYNCDEGILTKNILVRDIIISNNNFEGIHKSAIEVSNCMNGSVYISGNHVNAINNGSTFDEANEANKGIWAHNHRPGYSGLIISENEIWNSRFGIQITNNETGKIVNNYIYTNIINDEVNISVFYRRGVKLENCRHLEVLTNHVTRTCADCNINTTDLEDKLAGIHEVMGMGNKIEENEITNIPTGISINGNCSNTQYSCNILNNGYEGFRLANGAVITEQGSVTSPSGNKWLGDYVYRINNIDMALPVIWWYKDNVPEELPSGNLLGIYLNPTSSNSCIITNCSYCDQERLAALINFTNDSIIGNENRYYNQNFILRSITDSMQLMYSGSLFDIPLQNFFTLYSMSNLGLINSINDALSMGEMETAKLLNETLISSNLIEANTRIVNSYESRFKCDSVAIADSDFVQLVPIAYQLPFFGGEAVFRARSILGIDLNDTQLSSRQDDNKNFIKPDFLLFPNPNNGYFYVTSTCFDAHATLNIYNIQAQLISSIKLNEKKYCNLVSLNEVPNGLYQVVLTYNNNIQKTWKVLIQK